MPNTVINIAVIKEERIIRQIAEIFGAQCIVLSMGILSHLPKEQLVYILSIEVLTIN